MNTETTTLTLPRVSDFLRNDQKKSDWRYETWETLSTEYSNTHETERKIYWLGTIELNQVWVDSQNIKKYIKYSNKYWEFEHDSFTLREEDGAAITNQRMVYDLREIKTKLEEAKKISYKYFNVLLEEKVNYHGAHSVSLLFRKNLNGSPVYGVLSEKPWFHLSVLEITKEISKMIDGDMDKIVISSSRPYNWQK